MGRNRVTVELHIFNTVEEPSDSSSPGNEGKDREDDVLTRTILTERRRLLFRVSLKMVGC